MPSLRRRAAVSISVLLLMPMLFLLVVLAIYAAELVRVRSAMQANADAAALASASALIDDSRLLGDQLAMPILLQRAREAAQASALENIVGRQGVEIRLPRDDEEPGAADIEFGTRAAPTAPFVPVRAATSGPAAVAGINAVQIRARRTTAHGDPLLLLRGPFLSRLPTDIEARATAMIERDIIGIRPLPTVNAPLVPIALLSDPSGDNKRSWEYNTVLGKGTDDWAISRKGPRPSPTEGSDGLREMIVSLGEAEANGKLLRLSPQGEDALAAQAEAGVSAAQLAGLGGELVLDEKEGTVSVPESSASAGEPLGEALLKALKQGEPRIFPLYRKAAAGQVALSGFVAARVLAVRMDQGGPLRLVVQPAMRSTPSAVTASSRKRKAEANPYLARLRLAD